MITTDYREVVLGDMITLCYIRSNPFAGIFQNIAMPLVRRRFPTIFASQIVGVKALGVNNGRG